MESIIREVKKRNLSPVEYMRLLIRHRFFEKGEYVQDIAEDVGLSATAVLKILQEKNKKKISPVASSLNKSEAYQKAAGEVI